MKCTNCGFEQEQEFRFCPQCGADNVPVTDAVNTAAERILPALKDTLFLVICILMAAGCIMSITAGNFPLISILLTVFLWLAWNQARTGSTDAQQLRNVSGTVYAQYVINYVVAVLVLVVGVIFVLAFGVLADVPEFWDTLTSGFADMGETYVAVAEMIASVSGGILMAVFVVIFALIMLFNIFAMRKIHRFAKSVYRSLERQTLALESVGAAKVWLIVFAVFSCISTLSSLLSGSLPAALSSGCSAAAIILAVMLINKYFSEQA